MGIEDILMYDETIFQNINAFDPDYMPPDYNHRDTAPKLRRLQHCP